jgi:hypothetical protein
MRLSVAAADFDVDEGPERRVTVRATDRATGRSVDAVITVRLARRETTVFIDPGWSGCHSGTRACPFGSWDAALGGAGQAFGMEPGFTYLQRRGTVTGDRITAYVTGTPEAHIVLGSYGAGDRPVFDGSLRYAGSRYSVAIALGDTSYVAEDNHPVAYYDLYSLAFTGWYAGVNAGSTGTRDCTFTDLYATETRGMGIYLMTNYVNGLGADSVDILDHRVVDCVSEYAEGEPADEYGFKSEAGGTTFRYDVARFNKDVGFSGASAGYQLSFESCQAFGARDGIKAHGDDIRIDHTLIRDNPRWGVNVGNYYQANYGLSTARFRIERSLVEGNGVGVHVSQDARDGRLETTTFRGNGVAVGFYRDGSFEGVPTGFVIARSRFDGNGVAVDVGTSGAPVPDDITMAYDLFYGQAETPVVVSAGSNVRVYNSVFHDNAGADEIVVAGGEPFAARNNLLEGLIAAAEGPGRLIDHNLALEPGDVLDATGRDYHLVDGSPAIDGGVAVGLDADFEGRPLVGLPDVGAFERTPRSAPE